MLFYGSDADQTIRVGAIGDRINLLLIYIQGESTLPRYDGDHISLVQASVYGWTKTGRDHIVALLWVCNQGQFVRPIRANAQEISLTKVGAENDATTAALDNRHLDLKNKVAQVETVIGTNLHTL